LAVFAGDGISPGYTVALRILGELELVDAGHVAASGHPKSPLAMWPTLREPYGTAQCLTALGEADQIGSDAARAIEAWTEVRDHHLESATRAKPIASPRSS
jgi:hypothetical protein